MNRRTPVWPYAIAVISAVILVTIFIPALIVAVATGMKP